ncbi:MAG: hypothetical protein ABSG53_24695 [Thermoguttaceae bacterium]|jgi:hypothetical protein
MPTPSRPEFIVFYAWQSDRPGNQNRYLIQEAAAEAAAKITADPASPYDVCIDQDTQGVPGLCDIPATILEKIDRADSFLCDLTYVAVSTDETEDDEDFKPRYCSNPNVLFELGYAFRSMGSQRLLCVMNERYGPVAEQIFDIAHRRFPFTYRYPVEGMTRPKVRDDLAARIEEGIRALLPLGLRSESTTANRVHDIRTEFETCVKDGNFHGLVRRRGAVAIAIIPGAERQINWEELKKHRIHPPGSDGSNLEICGKAVLSFVSGKHGRFGLTELRSDGVILAADTSILDSEYNQDQYPFVPSTAAERAIITSVAAYLRALQALNAPLPWHICVSLLEIRGYCLLVSNYEASQRAYAGHHVIADPLIVRSLAEIETNQKIATFLRPIVDFIWREFGVDGSYNYTENGIYNNRLWL